MKRFLDEVYITCLDFVGCLVILFYRYPFIFSVTVLTTIFVIVTLFLLP